MFKKKNSIVIGPKRFEKQHGYNAFVIPSSFYIVHEKGRRNIFV